MYYLKVNLIIFDRKLFIEVKDYWFQKSFLRINNKLECLILVTILSLLNNIITYSLFK